MILQIATDRRHGLRGRDAKAGKESGIGDAGELQQLRRTDAAGAQDHRARGLRPVQRAVPQVADSRSAPAFEFDPSHLRAQSQLQVRPAERWAQIGRGGGVPAAVARRGRVDTDSFAVLAVEVRGVAIAECFTGFDIGAAQRVRPRIHVSHAQHTRTTVGTVFYRFKHPPHLGPAPAGLYAHRPVIEVGRLAAHVYHGVDRSGAAEHPAARPEAAHAVQARIGFRFVHPVDARIVIGAPITDRYTDPEAPVRAARLQQQHPIAAARRQPAGQYTAGRAGADDDVIEGLVLVHDPRALAPTIIQVAVSTA